MRVLGYLATFFMMLSVTVLAVNKSRMPRKLGDEDIVPLDPDPAKWDELKVGSAVRFDMEGESTEGIVQAFGSSPSTDLKVVLKFFLEDKDHKGVQVFGKTPYAINRSDVTRIGTSRLLPQEFETLVKSRTYISIPVKSANPYIPPPRRGTKRPQQKGSSSQGPPKPQTPPPQEQPWNPVHYVPFNQHPPHPNLLPNPPPAPTAPMGLSSVPMAPMYPAPVPQNQPPHHHLPAPNPPSLRRRSRTRMWRRSPTDSVNF